MIDYKSNKTECKLITFIKQIFVKFATVSYMFKSKFKSKVNFLVFSEFVYGSGLKIM